MYKIEITDASAIEALDRIIALGQSPQPALKAIGEVLTDFTKRRFVESADPYGVPWIPNADTTLRRALHRKGGSFTKKGKLSAKGQAHLAGKKPLIGESRSLSTQIHYAVVGDDLVKVSSTMIYARMQHEGAFKGQFGRDRRNHPIPWGNVPARPFFPDPARGLPDPLKADVGDVLRIALKNAAHGSKKL